MSTNKRPLRGLALAAAFAVGAGGIAACSDDDDRTSEDTTTTTEADANGTDNGNGEEATGTETSEDVVVVEMFDYGYELPEEVSSGSTLEVINESDEEVHEVVLFQISDDETRDVEELVELPPDEMETLMADGTLTMVGVGFAAPESDEGIYPLGDLVVEEPGRYALLCNIATGADPDEWLEAADAAPGPPDVGDGPPHLVHGMWAELTVS